MSGATNLDLDWAEDEGIRAYHLASGRSGGKCVRCGGGGKGGGGGAAADESEPGGFCADGVVVAFY